MVRACEGAGQKVPQLQWEAGGLQGHISLLPSTLWNSQAPQMPSGRAASRPWDQGLRGAKPLQPEAHSHPDRPLLSSDHPPQRGHPGEAFQRGLVSRVWLARAELGQALGAQLPRDSQGRAVRGQARGNVRGLSFPGPPPAVWARLVPFRHQDDGRHPSPPRKPLEQLGPEAGLQPPRSSQDTAWLVRR